MGDNRLISMTFVHKDGSRMREPLTFRNKDEFKLKFVKQTNKLKLNKAYKGTDLFKLFGKEAELVEFGSERFNMHTTDDAKSWKASFDKALGGCEMFPMKMWFRGINKAYKTPKSRRLSALSERFRRVCEFQASTE